MKVLSFGEILWDIIEGKHYLGGAPFNFAAHFSQCGADTYMISRLGKDELGRAAFEEVEKLGVETDFIQWDERQPTGTVDVFLKNGQPSYTIHTKVAYDYIDFDQLKASGLLNQQFDIFGFGSLAQRNETSKQTLRAILTKMSFSHIFYDVNLRKDCYSAAIIRDALSFSTILKLNDEEVALISEFLYGETYENEEFCQKVSQDYQQEIIIITAGGDGCFVYHKGELHIVAGKKVKVADTVGAGDSFSAAFLATFFRLGDPLQAAVVANQVGAFVAASRGPIPLYSEEIKELLGIS